MSEMKVALDQLLGGAALAFWTSVIGIFSSLLFNRYENSVVNKLKVQYQRINNQITSSTSMMSNQEISLSQLRSSEQQTDLLKSLNSSIVSLLQNKSKVETEALKDIVNSFRQELTRGAPTEMKAIAEGCQDILSTIKESIYGLKDSNQSLTAAGEKAGLAIKESLNNAAEEFHNKLCLTTEMLQTTAKNTSAELGMGLLESGIFAAEQIKEPVREITQSVKSLSDHTRKATNDWSDAMVAMERFASSFEQNTSRTPQSILSNNSRQGGMKETQSEELSTEIEVAGNQKIYRHRTTLFGPKKSSL
jgi:hypothetical protein